MGSEGFGGMRFLGVFDGFILFELLSSFCFFCVVILVFCYFK